MRAVLLSDTHGFVDPRVLELCRGAELVVHAGDVGGREVLEELAAVAGSVVVVRGNNDVPGKWQAEEAAVLSSLPAAAQVPLPGGLLAVEHGHEAGPLKDRHARLRRRHDGARAVVVGHSHRLARDEAAEPWVLNPGAAGRERTNGGPSVMTLLASEEGWCVEVRRFPPLAR